MKKGRIAVLVVLVFLALTMLGMVPALAEVPHRGNWAIGSHLSLPTIGPSVKYWFTRRWCGQFTFVPSIESTTGEMKSSINAYAGKAIYKLTEGKNHYFFGALSIGTFSLCSADHQYEYEMHISGTALTIGFEWIPRKWLALSFEIGYGQFKADAYFNGYPIDFGEEYKTINSPMIGFGIHSYLGHWL